MSSGLALCQCSLKLGIDMKEIVSQLIISQVSGGDQPEFVITNANGDASQAIRITSPYDYVVPNAGGASLISELRWSLERFLQYPFPPDTNRSERASEALKDWGTKTFKELFIPHAIGWLPKSAGDVFSVVVSSDDPHVLSWPWEALRDERFGMASWGSSPMSVETSLRPRSGIANRLRSLKSSGMSLERRAVITSWE